MNGDVENIRKSLKKPVVMIGLMGAGKTKIGGMLGQALGVTFVDADHEIEAAAGCSIADIFEQYGEPAFRDLERKVIARLLSDDIRVVATGGGAVMNAQTADLIWSSSIAVWLKADLDTLVQRTSQSGKRPLLLRGDPRAILADLMEKRHPVYAGAPVMVASEDGEPEATLEKTLNALANYLAAKE